MWLRDDSTYECNDTTLQSAFIQDPTPDATAAAAAPATTTTPTPATNATADLHCSATQPCQNGGTCGANNLCTCVNGFSGAFCEVNPCANVVCDRFSKCEAGKCVPDPCGRINCLNGGTCIGGQCTCKDGFSGAFCQDHPCNAKKCLNGGICKVPGTCYCLNGFTGEHCEISPCKDVVCLNGGKCLYGKCVCMPEWSGERCDHPSEVARDFHQYEQNVQNVANTITEVSNRIAQVHNTTNPAYISNIVRAVVREIQDKVHTEAVEKSKQDFMTPKVIGVKPVTHKDMRMPNTPMENAKIYEDRDLAYKKAREVRDKKLLSAMDLVSRFDEFRTKAQEILAAPVPFEENMPNPFGSLASIQEKYLPVDGSLLDADLQRWREEQAKFQEYILS